MRIILITAHLPRLIAQSNIRNGLYNGLIFYYITDNFVQCTFQLFDLSFWENRLPASVADFLLFWVWPLKRGFTAGIIRLTYKTVVVAFRLTF